MARSSRPSGVSDLAPPNPSVAVPRWHLPLFQASTGAAWPPKDGVGEPVFAFKLAKLSCTCMHTDLDELRVETPRVSCQNSPTTRTSPTNIGTGSSSVGSSVRGAESAGATGTSSVTCAPAPAPTTFSSVVPQRDDGAGRAGAGNGGAGGCVSSGMNSGSRPRRLSFNGGGNWVSFDHGAQTTLYLNMFAMHASTRRAPRARHSSTSFVSECSTDISVPASEAPPAEALAELLPAALRELGFEATLSGSFRQGPLVVMRLVVSGCEGTYAGSAGRDSPVPIHSATASRCLGGVCVRICGGSGRIRSPTTTTHSSVDTRSAAGQAHLAEEWCYVLASKLPRKLAEQCGAVKIAARSEAEQAAFLFNLLPLLHQRSSQQLAVELDEADEAARRKPRSQEVVYFNIVALHADQLPANLGCAEDGRQQRSVIFDALQWTRWRATGSGGDSPARRLAGGGAAAEQVFRTALAERDGRRLTDAVLQALPGRMQHLGVRLHASEVFQQGAFLVVRVDARVGGGAGSAPEAASLAAAFGSTWQALSNLLSSDCGTCVEVLPLNRLEETSFLLGVLACADGGAASVA